ncbi:MAG: alternative oxidase [Patescibacteria group bacterium]
MENNDTKPRISPFVLFIGRALFVFMDFMYGKKPSLGKFRVLEVVARIPYQSWEAVHYFLTTHLYANERRATNLFNDSKFARSAQDNETMHVVVITQMCKSEKTGTGILRFYLIPLLIAYLYNVFCLLFYFFTPRKAYELNYIFEDHAREQYTIFIENNEQFREKPLQSKFLEVYGRANANYYDFFTGVRDDEIKHRDRSLEAMNKIDRRKQNQKL